MHTPSFVHAGVLQDGEQKVSEHETGAVRDHTKEQKLLLLCVKEAKAMAILYDSARCNRRMINLPPTCK